MSWNVLFKSYGFVVLTLFGLCLASPTPAESSSPLASSLPSLTSSATPFHPDGIGLSNTLKDVSGQLRSKTSPMALYIESLTTLPNRLDEFLTNPVQATLKSQDLLLLVQTIGGLLLVFLLELLGRRILFFSKSKDPKPKSFLSVLLSITFGPLLYFGFSMGLFWGIKSFSGVFLFLYHFSLGLLGLRFFLAALVHLLEELKACHPRIAQTVSLMNPLFLGCYLTIFTQSYLKLLHIEEPLFTLIIMSFTLVLLALLIKFFMVLYALAQQGQTDLQLSTSKKSPPFLEIKGGWVFASKRFWISFLFLGVLINFFWLYTPFSRLVYIKFFTSGLILLLALGIIITVRYLLQRAYVSDSLLYKIMPVFSVQFSRSLLILRKLITLFLAAIAFILAAHIWGIHLIEWFNDTFQIHLINLTIDVTILIFIGLLTTDLIETSFIHYVHYETDRRSAGDSSHRHSINWLHTLLPIFQKAIRTLIFIVFFLIILSQIRIDVTPFLAGLSLLGLAISFGAQTYIKNIIAGLNLLFSGCLSINDLVEIGKHKGRVESLNLRAVELRDLDTGAIHIIPFGEISEITNYTREYNFCSFELNLRPTVNLEKLSQIIQKVLDAMNQEPFYKDMILGPAEIWGIKSMDSTGICVQCRFKISPFCTLRIKPAFLERLHSALLKSKIPLCAPLESLITHLTETQLSQ